MDKLDFNLKDSKFSLAVVMACFNRKAVTLKCLEALMRSDIVSSIDLTVYLVDDNSSDGTPEAVQRQFPQVNLLKGTGSLYWNGGMRKGMDAAMSRGHDFYLWLNDDTILFSNSISRMLEQYFLISKTSGNEAIIVGSTKSPLSGETTYGGLKRASKWRPLKFVCLEQTGEAQKCDTMHGNCVLLSDGVVKKVGNLEEKFFHRIGDNDYGLRASKLGIPLWTLPDFAGYCTKNDGKGSYGDGSLPLKIRMRKLLGPKGLPPSVWYIFVRRHAGRMWFFYFLWPYVKTAFSWFPLSWLKKARRR